MSKYISFNSDRRKRLTPKQKDEVVNKYINGFNNCKQLGKEYGISGVAIRGLLIRRGIEIKHGSLSELEKLNIINDAMLNDITHFDLSKKYNIKIWSSRRILKANNIKLKNGNKKYTCNSDYFNLIDTENKAYFLGLLYADGYIYEDNTTFGIDLQEGDKDILEKFNLSLESNRPLLTYQSNNPKQKNKCRLLINDSNIHNSLLKLGLIPNKSLILKFPSEKQVPKHLIRHFIRGYVDGDGGISCFKNKKGWKVMTCTITSSSDFCLYLRDFIKKEINVNSSLISIKSNNNIKRVSIGGNKQTVFFLNWIYSDCNIYMKRKYDKYEEILNVRRGMRKLCQTK